MNYSLTYLLLFGLLLLSSLSLAAPDHHPTQTLKKMIKTHHQPPISLIFDLPVTYNHRVTKWVHYFQKSGQKWFRTWLERSTKHMPYIQSELAKAGLPQDLAYMVMIESGFNANAISSADAVGPWQFIEATGKRYGLKVTPWLDERRDIEKSTGAAIRYLTDLHREFKSWYLVAASYNMGENGLRRQVQKHATHDFWKLAEKKAIPQETIDYVPKILAAMLISKAPSLYGFRDIPVHQPLTYDRLSVPGGTHLYDIANLIGVTHRALEELNPSLLRKQVPPNYSKFIIKLPKGSATLVSQGLKETTQF